MHFVTGTIFSTDIKIHIWAKKKDGNSTENQSGSFQIILQNKQMELYNAFIFNIEIIINFE